MRWRAMTPRFLLCVLAGTASLLLSATALAEATVRKVEDGWVLENPRLKVTFASGSGRLAVLDKTVMCLYQQESEGPVQRPPRATIRKAAAPLGIDGDLGDWNCPPIAVITYDMTPDGNWKNVKDNRDCSALLYALWDEKRLYIGAKVIDDRQVWGETGREKWWDRDSVEFWVGGRQVGLNLTPTSNQARSASSPIEGEYKIAMAVAAQVGDSRDAELIGKPGGMGVGGAPGYVVEAAFPWTAFPNAPKARVGAEFQFSFGVNDADATGEREGQIYFPVTWTHSKPDTFATAVLADALGIAPPTTGPPAANGAKARDVAALAEPAKGISFATPAKNARGEEVIVNVRLSIADSTADLAIDFDMMDRDTEIADISVLEPLVLDSPDGFFAVADYSNGHIYSVHDPKPPRSGFATDRMDMPWIGILDLRRGFGYILVIDTPDDGYLRMKRCNIGGKAVQGPQIAWRPSLGTFRYPRRLVYHFSSQGSYVALAKYYREYARARGLIVPFTEKVKKNPNIERLFGAPDVWGGHGLKFCREVKAAGVDRMLINGRFSAEDMKEINALGYLTSEYDNYTDILQLEAGQKVGSNRANLPDDAVQMRDGKRMTAWLTYDKKTQFMKRCPSLWVPTATQVIPGVLEKYPYLGRFIDVTTAEGLYECYDPKHPLTREQKRQAGVSLLSVVRENGLVVGGEHGIWWAVPVCDYIEGMMSGSFAAWPAGHLVAPKSMAELTKPEWQVKCSSWDVYEKYGIGHYYRVPLWELVFHDCIVSTWYWGDSTDFLVDAAPEITDKKDAFNVLYGTVPLLWANRAGKRFEDLRDLFIRSYRNTCKLHEAIAYDEMLSHEFVTADHAVQRTRFSSGTVCTVNFGEKPYEVTEGDRAYVLPTNGFLAKGPKVFQYKAVVAGRLVTYIEAANYVFADGHGELVDTGTVATRDPVTLRVKGPNEMRLICEKGMGETKVYPERVMADWDVGTTKWYVVDENGRRMHAVGPGRAEKDARFFDILSGTAARKADLVIGDVVLSASRPKQGEKVQVSATVQNIGLIPATANVHVYMDAKAPERILFRRGFSIAAGAEERLTMEMDTSFSDGHHRLIVIADPEGGVGELSEGNNESSCDINVAADPSRWPYRVRAVVTAGSRERVDFPVGMPLDLDDMARRANARGRVNAHTIRVFESDAKGDPLMAVPAQFDAGAGEGRGELTWILTGATPAGAARRFTIAFDTDPASKMLPPGSASWDDGKQAVTTPAYSIVFADGVISGLYDRLSQAPDKSILRSLIISSKATGWNREEGTTDQFSVTHSGPVRTIVVVKKTLAKDYVYEKTYTFYPRWFEVETSINKSVGGLYSRAWYAQEGQFEDDKGNRAVIDGKGDAEGVYGKNKDARWYCVYTSAWAHSCIALSPAGSLAYWDAGSMGGTGFHMPGLTGKVAYVIHPGQTDANFAKADYEQLTSRPLARLE